MKQSVNPAVAAIAVIVVCIGIAFAYRHFAAPPVIVNANGSEGFQKPGYSGPPPGVQGGSMAAKPAHTESAEAKAH